jgi:hypothetical protein
LIYLLVQLHQQQHRRPQEHLKRRVSFDQRWAVWQAKGAAHEPAVRRKMALAAPIVIIVAAVIYVLLGR